MTGAGRTTVAMATSAGMLLLSVRVLRSHLALIRVTGSSMTPAFADGDRLLVRRTTRVRRGDAVVFRNPVPFGDGDDALAWLVKRVSALPGDAVPPDVREIVGAPDGALVPPRFPDSPGRRRPHTGLPPLRLRPPVVPAGRGTHPPNSPRPLLNPLLTAVSARHIRGLPRFSCAPCIRAEHTPFFHDVNSPTPEGLSRLHLLTYGVTGSTLSAQLL
jgi:signal peptidase I